MGTRSFVPLALFVAAVVGCGNVPDDPGARIFPAAGVIEGSVLYQGPHPCSFDGHIVGNAILLVFDRRNLPPPNGLAVISANFADVTGDELFANEPRYTGTDAVYCPKDHGFTDTITVTAPFAVSPMSGGSFEIEGFFDYTGDFLPTFKFRELPERGDVAGGDIDTADALKPGNNGNPDYNPHFLPIEIGTPEQPSQYNPQNNPTPPGFIPPYDVPSDGFVANNVTVSLGSVLTNTRPYFYPQGLPYDTPTSALSGMGTLSSDGNSINNTTPVQSSDVAESSLTGLAGTAESDANYYPILTIPQDIQTLSAPDPTDLQNANANVDLFESVLPHLNLKFGVAPSELPCAASVMGSTGNPCTQTQVPGATDPFHFQLSSGSSGQGTFSVWQNAAFDPSTQTWSPLLIPEGNLAPMLWPEIILSKLIDSTPGSTPPHIEDPASLTAQGAANQPVVIIQGITFLAAPQMNPLTGMPAQGDTLFNTVLAGGAGLTAGTLFDSTTGLPAVAQQDHLTVAVRPAAICLANLFNTPASLDTRGTLVTPYSGGNQASFAAPMANTGPIVPIDILNNNDPLHRYQATGLVNTVQFGCLPKGRYAINVVYPNGQAWTVPNETGACSGSEGSTDYTGLTCTLKPRPILPSQGNRAVVEIVGPTNSNNCVNTGPAASPTFAKDTVQIGSAAPAVPVACLPRCETQPCSGPDTCTQVNDANGGTAMVCLPP